MTSMRGSYSLESKALESALGAIGCQKLGQPVPDSNLVRESKSLAPQQTHRNVPLKCPVAYLPEKAGSVAFSRVTMNCSGVRIFCHSSGDLTTRPVFESADSPAAPFGASASFDFEPERSSAVLAEDDFGFSDESASWATAEEGDKATRPQAIAATSVERSRDAVMFPFMVMAPVKEP